MIEFLIYNLIYDNREDANKVSVNELSKRTNLSINELKIYIGNLVDWQMILPYEKGFLTVETPSQPSYLEMEVDEILAKRRKGISKEERDRKIKEIKQYAKSLISQIISEENTL